jgi:eukaryotic-like serine/threonine-protein kinase
MPKVILKYNDKVIKEIQLADVVVTIGRKADNDLVIDNLAVSSHHARIAKLDDGFVIQDTGSTNGIFLNGEKVAQHALQYGDQIMIGKHFVVFQDDMPVAAAPPPAAEGSGTQKFGRYEVVKKLGSGAMGTVYLGRDIVGRRTVAVKTLKPDGVDAQELADMKERFFREAESAKQLAHPAIVKVYDAGEERGTAYFAMELLDGVTLKEFCSKRGLISVKRAVEIVAFAAEALAYAHGKNVVHRDVKPENIMMLSDGDLKLTDFGVAKLMDVSQTQSGVVLGTPNYMSPEQLIGAKVDGRSDLFSLGVVCYELLTGARPFQAKNIAEMLRLHEAHQPPAPSTLRPEVPPSVDAIVLRALQRDLAQRYQQGDLMAKDLRAAMHGLVS